MTPHMDANKGDIAKTVLMPGDPLRAKYIADNFLKNCKLVNQVRGILAYTGEYKGKKVTVMASGMGMPSIGIYSYELYKFYDVENIIRIGTAGAYSDSIDLFDIVISEDAYSQSSFASLQGYDKDTIPANSELNDVIIETAKRLNKKYRVGRIHSTDIFYGDVDINDLYYNKKCLAVEMESFALFYNALKFNKKAACILTISDNLITKKETTSYERQTALNDMIVLALETTLNI